MDVVLMTVTTAIRLVQLMLEYCRDDDTNVVIEFIMISA